MNKKFLVGLAAAAAVSMPASAQAHALTCGTHQSEVRNFKPATVARMAGARCFQVARNEVEYVAPQSRGSRYILHQRVRYLQGSEFYGMHITMKLHASGIWRTFFG